MTDQPRDRIEGLEPEKLMRAALRASLQSSSSSPNANERSAKDELELRAEIEARLPDLELLELLGRGGMGSVFRARQRKLDREVALKVVYPDPEHRQEFADRFEREARALARLNHPNLVSIFDYGQDGGFGWLRPKRSRWCPRSATRCSTRTTRASSTATSSPRTSCSTTRAA